MIYTHGIYFIYVAVIIINNNNLPELAKNWDELAWVEFDMGRVHLQTLSIRIEFMLGRIYKSTR